MHLRFGVQNNVRESVALDICLLFSILRLFYKTTVFTVAGSELFFIRDYSVVEKCVQYGMVRQNAVDVSCEWGMREKAAVVRSRSGDNTGGAVFEAQGGASKTGRRNKGFQPKTATRQEYDTAARRQSETRLTARPE
ncbi:hypothetical protein J2Z19_004246 [Ensifer adhaerens]|uniref:Uncharacterized protein n=1 Tax=Ensifer adhaerens TaxID=106592 RepID=A0ACC5T099_ENSAD|nr:hypothetical protein [Ensifer adhaerens]MBP1874520.1 hypothetical protein [Ensifer adhaerens]